MPKFRTIAEALRYANTQLLPAVDTTLETEVFDAAKTTYVAAAETVVYDAYEPKMYERRGEYDGLADPYNVVVVGDKASNGKVTIRNITKPNPNAINAEAVTTGKSLPALIEYGHGYKGNVYDFPRRGREYMKPRPFTYETRERLAAGLYRRVLKAGLKTRLPDDAEIR